MAFGRGYLDSRNNEKIIDGLAVFAHQALLQKIGNRFAGVVIGDGEPVQTFGPRRGNNFFGARYAVSGEERMGMQVDIERHWLNASLEASKWKALVSKNGLWCVKRLAAAGKVSFCAKAESQKGEMVSHLSIASSFYSRPGFMNSARKCGPSRTCPSSAGCRCHMTQSFGFTTRRGSRVRARSLRGIPPKRLRLCTFCSRPWCANGLNMMKHRACTWRLCACSG